MRDQWPGGCVSRLLAFLLLTSLAVARWRRSCGTHYDANAAVVHARARRGSVRRIGELLALILPLALGAAVSPLTLLAMLAVLSGPRPIARGAALTAGVITLTGLLLGVGFVLITATDYGEPGTRGPLGSPVASTTVGGALITYAAYLFFTVRRTTATPVRSRDVWTTRGRR